MIVSPRRLLPVAAWLAVILAVAVALGADAQSTSSAWDEPTLVNPTTIVLSDTNRNLNLGAAQDYVLQCPAGPLTFTGRLTVNGGHNVVLDGCNENMSVSTGGWAAEFENQTGTLWIHDVHFGGPDLTGGFQMQEPGSTTVVLRDILFDTVHGSQATNHAECIQTWSGPQTFLIDGLVCPTTYQGLYLLPNQHDTTTVERQWDFRDVRIDGTGGYDLWLDGVNNAWGVPQFPAPFSLNLQSVYDCGSGEPRDWSGNSANHVWAGVLPCPTASGGEPVWATPNGATGLDEPDAPTPLGGE